MFSWSAAPKKLPRTIAPVASAFGLDPLEPRLLLSAFSWTPEEVYLLELLNRARANPLAEEVRLNALPGTEIDLTAGLTAGEIARLIPSEPLALNSQLTLAARAHSLDMAERDFFDHVNPDGQSPTDRANEQSYAGSAGENIAAGYASVDLAHRAWIDSVGHRKNVFSLHTNFDSTFHYDEFGPGFAFTTIQPYEDFYTQLFGVPATPLKYVLGVVYSDTNGNAFYDLSEGAANVRVDVMPQSDPFTLVGTYTTDAAGNYQIPVPAGAYNVVFTNLSTGLSLTRQVTVSSVNVKADARTAQLTTDLDDHADAGDFDDATAISLDAVTGDGADTGILEDPTDMDIFRFTAAGTGPLTVRLNTASGSLLAGLGLFGPTESPLGSGSPDGSASELAFTFNAVEGQSYYILVESVDAATAGPYAVTIDGPVGTPSGGENPFGAGEGSILRGAAGSGGRLTLTASNEDGRPIIYYQELDGSWSVIDLLATAGGPTITGDPLVWTDPKDGLSYVAATSGDGLVLYRRGSDGTWTLRNLSAELPQAELITGGTTSFVSLDGFVTVAGLASDGDLLFYQQTGATTNGQYTWSAANVSQRDLVPQGLSTPAFDGALISYVTAWNGLNVVGLDAQGNIQTVWWSPGMAAWTTNNLSAITGAAPIAGGLTAYLTSWSGINLAGVNSAGELTVTWWVPQFGGDWANNNLTADIGGPLVQPDSVASYVTSWGGLNVVAADMDGELVAYWWSPDVAQVFGEDRWQLSTLSAEVADGPAPSGSLTGVSFGDTISVVGATDEGNIFRYWWQIGGAWQAQDLTAVAIPR